jgi:hypothetical protein
MDQHLADQVGGVRVFTLLGVVVLEEEITVAVFDNRPGMCLDFVHHAEDFVDFGVNPEARINFVFRRQEYGKKRPPA